MEISVLLIADASGARRWGTAILQYACMHDLTWYLCQDEVLYWYFLNLTGWENQTNL